jgi:hypothetical protein
MMSVDGGINEHLGKALVNVTVVMGSAARQPQVLVSPNMEPPDINAGS